MLFVLFIHLFIYFLFQHSDSRLPSSEESPDRKRKDEKHRRTSGHSEANENGEQHELSEDELEKQRAQLLRELQMQQEDN